MSRRIVIWAGLCAVAWLSWANPGVAEETSAAAQSPIEHHLYLHVVQPDSGERVRIVISERDLLPPPPATPALTVTEDEPEIDLTPREAGVAEADLPAADDTVEEAEDIPPPEESVQEADEDVPPEVTDIPAAEAVEDDAVEQVVADTDALEPPLPLEAEPVTTVAEKASEVKKIIVVDEPSVATPTEMPLGLLLFIFVLAIFLGFELISKVPSQLHTPLMSGSNAISGITIVGALAAAGLGVGGPFGTLLGLLAVIFASINVVGGYLVTNRMLGMFKKKDGGAR